MGFVFFKKKEWLLLGKLFYSFKFVQRPGLQHSPTNGSTCTIKGVAKCSMRTKRGMKSCANVLLLD